VGFDLLLSKWILQDNEKVIRVFPNDLSKLTTIGTENTIDIKTDTDNNIILNNIIVSYVPIVVQNLNIQ
jgi:hypothetical protein